MIARLEHFMHMCSIAQKRMDVNRFLREAVRRRFHPMRLYGKGLPAPIDKKYKKRGKIMNFYQLGQGSFGDDSLRLPRRGRATIDAGVSSHTVRSVHPQKPSSRSKPLRDRMARLANPVVFFPAVLCCGTRRNAIWLQTCKRTTDLFSHGRVKTEMRDGRWAARMRIPLASRARGLSPRLVKEEKKREKRPLNCADFAHGILGFTRHRATE
jgi:hypothetical protein